MQETINTFTRGLEMDNPDLTTSTDVMINALNATLDSHNENHNLLQNDFGNVKILTKYNNDIITAQLPKGSIPIGSIVYEDIMYFALIYPDKNGNNIGEIGSFPSPDYNSSKGLLVWNYAPLYVGYESDETTLKPLRTSFFNWDLNNPLEIIAEKSYDNSINLIITDKCNNPILINTGFAALENGTYEIINRYGINNTNRYSLLNENSFKLLTSLSKITSNISNFQFLGIKPGGELSVGNYVFYAVACDKDGNETDFICESSIVPVFLGIDTDPFSAHGGINKEKSDKCVQLKILNIDEAYNYIKLYYSITSGQTDSTSTKLLYEINNLYNVVKDENDHYYCEITVTGFENTSVSSMDNLKTNYFNAHLVLTQTICQDFLFLGNITQKENSSYYNSLKLLSYHIFPTINLKENVVTDLDKCEYKKGGYNSAQNIYNLTGYHNGEIYRFGIVYIKKDNSLTDVFDIIGINNTAYLEEIHELIPNSVKLSYDKSYNNEYYVYPKINENSSEQDKEKYSAFNYGINTKGVTRLFNKEIGMNQILGITMKIPINFKDQLSKLGIKGYFFVRLKRIPTLLGQAYITNTAEHSFVPTLNVEGDYKRKKEKKVNQYSSKIHLVESFGNVDIECRKLKDDGTHTIEVGKEKISTYHGLKECEYNQGKQHLLDAEYNERLIPLAEYVGVRVNKKPLESQTSEVKFIDRSEQNIISQNDVMLSSFNANYVDLGLPSGNLWMKYDYGSSSENELGTMVYWGMTNGSTINPEDELYTTENIAGTKFDIITQTYGSNYQIPSISDYEELYEHCNITSEGDIWKFTSKKDSSKYIKFKVSGVITTDGLVNENYSYRWTSDKIEKYGSLIRYVLLSHLFWSYQIYAKAKMPVRGIYKGTPQLQPSEEEIITEDCVDLGFGNFYVSKYNLGANSETEFGNYYQWACTTPTTRGSFDEYPKSMYENINQFYKPGNNLEDISGTQYDAATQTLGNGWRIPNKDEQNLIVDFCTWKWIEKNGIWGCEGTSTINGNKIFLPAGGYLLDGSVYLDNSEIKYWNSTLMTYPKENNHSTMYDWASFMSCMSGNSPTVVLGDYRYIGRLIRPIKSKNWNPTQPDNPSQPDNPTYPELPSIPDNPELPEIIKPVDIPSIDTPGYQDNENVDDLDPEIILPWDDNNESLYNSLNPGELDIDPDDKYEETLGTEEDIGGAINGTESTTDGKYAQKIYAQRPILQNAFAGYCPEFLLNQAYYNNIFTGSDFVILPLTDSVLLTKDGRHYKFLTNLNLDYSKNLLKSKIIGVSDGISLISLQTNNTLVQANNNYQIHRPINYFSSKVGDASNYKFKYAGAKYVRNFIMFPDWETIKGGKNWDYIPFVNDPVAPCNLVRGIYSPYLGINCNNDIADKIVNIYIPNYSESNIPNYFLQRFLNNSAYYTISNRISFDNDKNINCYRGDCFKGIFTERVNRNFQDPTFPNNDEIIDRVSWSGAIMSYKVENGGACVSNSETNKTALKDMSSYRIFNSQAEPFNKLFNLGDINAVELGSWISFPVTSSYNFMLRSNDESYTEENMKMGNTGRTFYPASPMSSDGNHKVPESASYNQGYSSSSGFKEYANTEHSNSLKTIDNTYYKNRIYYSNKNIKGTSNNSRIFLNSHYQDVCLQFGSIIKLIEFKNYLIVILEHGICAIDINEKAVVSEAQSGNVVISSSKVIPDKQTILSSIYGSTYPESIVVTDSYVYGIDTFNKKIWRTNISNFELISDFKIQSFLNKNIQINNPIKIGTHNIKSHYNRGKGDVMFTFYDYNDDLLWNLCYNENRAAWITLYSWIPSYSGNIGENLISLNIEDINDINKKSYLYKHGYSNRVPSLLLPEPTKWYDEQHPFEFEFVVNPNNNIHKIWDCLHIISNKAEPESFHYEIVGECYDFALDKLNIYKRLEMLKKLYKEIANLPISYDKNAIDLSVKQNVKSTIFPLYYRRLDIINKIYDSYKDITNPPAGHDYSELTGTEIVHYPNLNEYRLRNHTKGISIDKHGRLRGNMRYVEDLWKIQINPISLIQNNEQNWNKIPIVLNTIDSTDLQKTTLTQTDLLNVFPDYTLKDVYLWHTKNRKEIKMKDKYLRIKVRYTGKELALIQAIKTLYTLSYT